MDKTIEEILNILIDSNYIQDLLNNKDRYQQMSALHNPYGDGKACERIVNHIKEIKL